MPRANRYFLAGSSRYISLTAATKSNSHGSFPAIDAGICVGFSKPRSEKLSQDSFGSYFRFPFNLTYFNNIGKIFCTTVLKALAHSSRYRVKHSVSDGRMQQQCLQNFFGEKLKEV